jgi:hypothetical protein
MEFLQQLWMPILLSAVLVFIASSIIHMALPVHKGEQKGLPDEPKVMAALEGVPAGQYMFPWCANMSDMNKPEYQEKLKKGPVGHMTVFPGPWSMGRNLLLMFVFYLVVGVFVAYVGWHSMGPNQSYLHAFRVCGAAAVMAHGLGWMPHMLWFGGPKKAFWSYLFDAIVYALLSAGTFGWLWPRG